MTPVVSGAPGFGGTPESVLDTAPVQEPADCMLRLRLKYEKTGPIRFTSHRDLMRIFRRSFASADIPVCFSQGFNPHPRLSFGPSLRTGWEGFDEYLDVLLEVPADDFADRCNRYLPDGLRFVETGVVAAPVPKLAADVSAARYEVYVNGTDALERRSGIHKPLLDKVSEEVSQTSPEWLERVTEALGAAIRERFSGASLRASTAAGGVESGGREPAIIDVRCSAIGGAGDTRVLIEYFSTMHGGRSLFPEDILTPPLADPVGYETPIRVVRRSLYVERGGSYVSPMSRAALEIEE